jgi:multidrug resistance efflux pump
MDRVKEKGKSSQLGRPIITAAGVAALIVTGLLFASIDFRTHRVDKTHITIDTVQQGTMEVKVAANGQLLSRSVEQLSAQVPGRVQKTDIKPGAVVQVGQELVELANPELVARAEEAQSAYEGAVAELRSAKAELQTIVTNQEVVFTQIQFNFEKAQVKTEADEALAKEGILSGIELKRSQLDRDQLKKTRELEANRLEQMRSNVEPQLAVRKSRVAQLARALERAQTQVADLKIVAGINGVVQSINVEVGQQVQPGSPIGRIARQDQLYAEIKVPARDATQVQPGQPVVVDTRNGTVDGVVTRVDPGVTDSTVVVDVDLQGPLPAGVRPQLPVEGTIYVARMPNTLYVGTPAYVKHDAAISVYKLDPAGAYATRTTIKAGKVSVNYLQVLEGLKAGDRIITSEIGEWQGRERILLK